jgi:hypothetical protein
MNGQIQYAHSRAVTRVATPRTSEAAVRVHAFRHELRSVGRQPGRTTLLRLVDRARELGLRDDEILIELHEIRVALDALDFAERLASDGLPVVTSVEPLPPGETCHFVSAVRFGRRRADQIGHVELTSTWLRCHGALDVRVVWSQVASVDREGRDIVVRLVESRRVLRVCCHSAEEAACGASVARHLAAQAVSYR